MNFLKEITDKLLKKIIKTYESLNLFKIYKNRL